MITGKGSPADGSPAGSSPVGGKTVDQLMSRIEELEQIRQSDIKQIHHKMQTLKEDMERTRQFIQGSTDAGQLLVDALMTWVESEPSTMWNKTRTFLERAEAMTEQNAKTWTREERQIWISDVTHAATAELQEITRSYRDAISIRAQRALASLSDQSKDTIERLENDINERIDKMTAKISDIVQQQVKVLVSKNREGVEKMMNQILDAQGKLPPDCRQQDRRQQDRQ